MIVLGEKEITQGVVINLAPVNIYVSLLYVRCSSIGSLNPWPCYATCLDAINSVPARSHKAPVPVSCFPFLRLGLIRYA